MTRLNLEDRALLDLARDADDPTAVERERSRGALARRLGEAAGLGVAAAVATRTTSAAGAMASSGATTAPAAAGQAAGAAAVAGSAGTGGTSALGAFTSIPAAAKVLLVAVVLGGGVSTYRAATSPSSPPPASSASALPRSLGGPTHRTAPEASAPALAPVAGPSSIASSAPSAVESATPAAGARRASARPSVAGDARPSFDVSSPVPTGDGLVAETELVREAVAALNSGDPSRALALFDRHARQFPNGLLEEERGAERVFALCQLGRVDEARRAATLFLAGHPSSRFASRVRPSCAAAPDENGATGPIP